MPFQTSPELKNWKVDISNDPDVPEINWSALQLYSIDLQNSRAKDPKVRKCNIHPKYTMGRSSLVRLLEFDDGSKCIARIQLYEPSDKLEKQLLHEFHTMTIVRERTKVPIPEIFGCEASPGLIGRPFMLMEFIQGNTLMNTIGYDEVPDKYKSKFSKDIADIHVAISSIRFPKIGMITKRDGQYDIDPIPDLGGPFDTAVEYLEAWGKNIKFPLTEDEMRSCSMTDEEIASTFGFASRIADERADIVSTRNNGPFPLRHDDFWNNNVIVDDEFNILSVIDWETLGTAPWETLRPPLFFWALPPALGLPERYVDGIPIEDESKRQWDNRDEYVRNVAESEGHQGCDNKLSTILASRYYQNLSGCLTHYEEGKMGDYWKALDQPPSGKCFESTK